MGFDFLKKTQELTRLFFADLAPHTNEKSLEAFFQFFLPTRKNFQEGFEIRNRT